MGRTNKQQPNYARQLVYAGPRGLRRIPWAVVVLALPMASVLAGATGFAGKIAFDEWKQPLLTSLVTTHLKETERLENQLAALRHQLHTERSNAALAQHQARTSLAELRQQQQQLAQDLQQLQPLLNSAGNSGLLPQNSTEPRPKVSGVPNPNVNDVQPRFEAETLLVPQQGQTQAFFLRGVPNEITIALEQKKTAMLPQDASQVALDANLPSPPRPNESFANAASALRGSLAKTSQELASNTNAITTIAEADIQRRLALLQALPLNTASRDMLQSASEKAPAPAIGGPYHPAEPADALALLQNALDRRQSLLVAQERLPLQKPLPTLKISSAFGPRMDPFLRKPAMHHGIDAPAKTGTPISSSALGRVTFAGRNGGYGLAVEIDHGNGITSKYAHLHKITVKKGQMVIPGETLGLAGNTGRSTGPHLHFETRVDGKPVDPMPFLKVADALSAAS
ncbi:M23 family metallopeptidase [Polycladidibacter hongkongensis]|uniref:M23 family metallopeptidase n=1 Tax=Polycladidibacter hongkongensis TaxID=1647556 RepID=UPI000830143C|nr:M23 family metallopeptidase [Pseudovibrio hongkongensis]